MARLALISDIHANLEALRAVLDHVQGQGVEEVACLGDVVGYGPDPEACADLVRERCSFTLMGNHDWGLFHDLSDFNPVAMEALVVTRRMLDPGLVPFRRKARERWKWLESLPERVERKGALFVHASPRDPIMEYVLRTDGFLDPVKMEAIFACFQGVCFVGHTHWPGVHTEDFRFTQATDQVRSFLVEPGRSAVVNVGSVGQPRDGDPRACYAVVDGGVVEWHRVAYDFRATQEKIRRLPLHDVLAERLARGR